ncbi:MAG TPA: hypothetical protein VHQ43_04515, partial [Solirubrobacterales bacterium]|nr:hypothetical protein [Solirubrobacterales bacterium]
GPDGTSATKFFWPQHLAVDQQAHILYVVDKNSGDNSRLYRFTTAGVPNNFTAGSGAGTNLAKIPFAGEVAVAPAGSPGATAGDVYLVVNGQVNVYSPQGALLGTIDGSGNPLTDHAALEDTARGLAVDAAGNLYVSYGHSVFDEVHHSFSFVPTSIDKYVPSAQPVANGDFDSQITGVKFREGGGLLAASAISLYVDGTKYPLSSFPGGGGTADASGNGVVVVADLPLALSVDPSNEDVYFGNDLGVGHYDKDGNLIATAETPDNAAGIAVDTASGKLFVSNNIDGVGGPEDKVRIYGPAEFPAPPSAELDPVSSLKFDSAHFSGTVNSGGTKEAQETTYRFQCTPACPGLQGDRSIPTDGADHEVSDDTTGLTPETTYEVTLIAKSKAGEDKATLSFETPAKPVATAPAVTIDAVTSFDSDSAHLTGTVDPMGTGENQATTYRFEYTRDGVKWISLGDQGPIEGSGPQAVSDELEGLEPNTGYSVRLKAENVGGEVTSGAPNPSLTTEAIAPQVEATAATQVKASSARLNGRVNPQNSQTTYYFQWGTSDCASNPCISVPASKDGDAGSGNGFEFVGADISGLSPGTAYSYRLIAKNPAGEVSSASRGFTTASAPSACSNADLQVGPAANLPECRAYEMVSPLQKGATDISTNPLRTRIRPDGNALTYLSTAAFAGAPTLPLGGGEYRAVRGPDGWSATPITPFQPTPPAQNGFRGSSYVGFFSKDLGAGVFRGDSPVPGVATPNVVGATNLYLATGMDSGAPSFQLLSDSTAPLGEEPIGDSAHIQFAGASADFGQILFEDTDNLLPEASGGLQKLYEWDEGSLSLTGILPDSACATPPCVATESVAGSGAMTEPGAPAAAGTYPQIQNAISADGSRVFFTAGVTSRPINGYWGSLYLREDAAHTVQIDASQRSTPDPGGPGRSQFQAATPDGKHVFFISKEALLDADTDGHTSIYRYDAEAPEGQRLKLLPTGATVVPEHVVDVSEDGAYSYWTGIDSAILGFKNHILFSLHDGEVHRIALREVVNEEPTLGEEGAPNALSKYTQARMTADGRSLLFASRKPLTGYDSVPAGDSCIEYYGGMPTGAGCRELFLFDADSGRLSCVSCDPSGEPPLGSASFIEMSLPGVSAGPFTGMNSPVTEDGHYVFFDTPDPLVERDSNGKRDVYVYDTEAETLQLISTGQCNCISYFLNASPSGHDVFFTTRQQLVRSDSDDLVDLYDARVGGGIASQNATPPAVCQGDACQPPASPPPGTTPSSLGFSGAGNPPAAHKKAKKHKKRRAHKKRSAHKRAAKSNQGGRK